MLLHAKVLEAKDIRESQSVFAALLIDEEAKLYFTEKIGSNHPTWNQEFDFHFSHHDKAILRVKVYNWDGLIDHRIGKVTIPMSSISDLNQDHDNWYEIKNKQGEVKGSIHLVLNLKESDKTNSDSDLDDLLAKIDKKNDSIGVDPSWMIDVEAFESQNTNESQYTGNQVESSPHEKQAIILQEMLFKLIGCIEGCPLEEIRDFELTAENIDSLCCTAKNSRDIKDTVNKHLPENKDNNEAIDSILTKISDESQKLKELLEAVTGEENLTPERLQELKDQFNDIKNRAKKDKSLSEELQKQFPDDSNDVESISCRLEILQNDSNKLKEAQEELCKLASAIEGIPPEEIKPEELTRDKIDSLCGTAKNSKDIKETVSKHLPETKENNEAIDSNLSSIINETNKLKELLRAITGNERIMPYELNDEFFNKIKQDAKKIRSHGSENHDEPHTNKSANNSSMNKIEILDSAAMDDLGIIEEIGSGGGGRVYKVYKKIIYALKEMNVGKSSRNNFKQFMNEYELMNMLTHPNILKTFGIFLSDNKRPPSILLEFCSDNLDNIVKNKSLSNVQIVFIIYQIVEGMKYVHFHQIIHRDLKPSNILVACDGTIKISDFGVSKLMTIEESMTRGVGTQKFMAPEIINEDEYDEKVDVYAFGVIVFFILNKGDLSNIKIVDMIKGKQIMIPSTFTTYAKKLIYECWKVESKERPSFKDILESMKNNEYALCSLDKSEAKELQAMIEQHKSKIPSY